MYHTIDAAFIGPEPDLRRLRARDPSSGASPAHLGGATPRVAWPPEPLTPADEPQADVIVHTGGGRSGAELVRRCLTLGRPVITGDYELLANEGPALRRLADNHDTQLNTRAAAIAAAPAVRELWDLLPPPTSIRRIDALLSPIADVFVSQLAQNTAPPWSPVLLASGLFDDALSGRDAARRLAVITQELTDAPISVEFALCLGIDGLEPRDVAEAGARGCTWRLVATAVGGSCLRVEPSQLPLSHPLATARPGYQTLLATTDEGNELLVDALPASVEAVDRALLQDLLATEAPTPAMAH